MTNSLLITTLGTPRPKQSARFVNGRAVGIAKANVKLRHWTKRLRDEARDAYVIACRDEASRDLILKIMTGAIRLDAIFYMPIKDQKKWGKPHTAKPDEDNLRKAVKDVLEAAGVLQNDSRIVGGETWKWYAKEGGCTLKLTPHGLEPDQDDPDDLGVGFVASVDDFS